MGQTDARNILDQRLACAGPLENLAPGTAEDLLVLADLADAPEVRARIVEALSRDRVPDDREAMLRTMVAAVEASGAGHLTVLAGVPPDGFIQPTRHPRRRTVLQRDKLLADLASGRIHARRWAAHVLGEGDGDAAIVDALRAATTDADAYTRIVATGSLGRVRDASADGWARALALVADADAAPRDLGEAIVLLAQLDIESRRAAAIDALERLRERHPAWTRDLRAFSAVLAQG